MLTELSDRQSDVRELLATIREFPDKTVVDAVAANSEYDDEKIVAMVLVRLEMDPLDRAPERHDLLWAIEILDHLDTQGWSICRK